MGVFCARVPDFDKEQPYRVRTPATPQPPRLLEQIRLARQRRHYSPRTAEACEYRVRDHVLFHHKRHLPEFVPKDRDAYLNRLVGGRRVSANIQS